MKLCGSLSILWHCLSLGLEWKLTFSSPVATAEFSKFVGILSAALSKHHLLGFEIAHASMVMLKILHARLQHYAKEKLPHVQARFRKERWTRNQIANICWIIGKARNSRKTSTSVSLTMPKPLTVWIILNYGKLLKRWEYQIILPVSWETCMMVKKQQVELCIEQIFGSRLRKEYDRAVCCHAVCLIYKLSTSWEMLGWMSSYLELESR